MLRVRIENVVASASLGVKLDLPALALAIDGAEYAPERFPGLICHLKEPKTAMLLFQSGKVVCTGGKSLHQVETTVRRISEQIRRSGQRIPKHPKIRVQNIVATADLEREINLTSVAVTLGLDRVEYEPEQFPGLVYRVEEPKVVVLLFGSGRMVCTGARRPSDVQVAVQGIKRELQASEHLGRDRGRVAPEKDRRARPAPPSPMLVTTRPADPVSA